MIKNASCIERAMGSDPMADTCQRAMGSDPMADRYTVGAMIDLDDMPER